MLPADIFQNRREGLAGYLNARIYVSDRATPGEIAAAANVAVRLTFEIHSMNLPIGFPVSQYDNSDTSVAIVIGSAAEKFTGRKNESIVVTTDGTRSVVAIPDVGQAEYFARSLGTELVLQSTLDESEAPGEKAFSLSSLFTSEGLLADADGDRIPERIETTIVLGPDVHAVEVIDLAARIALEATGCRLPLVVADSVETLPPNPILIGHSNRFLKIQGKTGRAPQVLLPGQGRIEVIGPSNGDGSSVVIEGADDAGESAAIRHAAERLPFLWDYGKDHLDIAHIEKDLRSFFSFRSEAGQAAAALAKARELSGSLTGAEIHSAQLEVLVNGDCRPCLEYIESQFRAFHAKAGNLNVNSGPIVFEDTHPLPWEVDEARLRIAKFVVPAIRSGSTVSVELRVSESPEVRSALESEIRKLALDRGADPALLKVHVLAAHKQGYCWIDEILKPRLKLADQIRIQYREITPGVPAPIESPHRWLHEIYPIDAVLSRDLGIPLDRITFQKADSRQASAYEVSAVDASGRSILNESFDPRFTMRPMFDLIPDYARVRVNTGWLQASVDGTFVADEQIETDPEKFWNVYQADTLPKIRDYILQLYEGKPVAASAPHFGTLEVELWLSEPDYRIGIGEERISTLEALHEDIYFETLLFLEILGLHNSGRIIPRVHQARDGQGGLTRIRFTGKAGPNPRVALSWKDRDGKSRHRAESLVPTQNGDPKITALTVQSGLSAVVSLEISGVPDSPENRSLLQIVLEFHQHGVGLNWLSYADIESLKFGSIEIPKTKSPSRKLRLEHVVGNEGSSIVQWDTPIGPDECEQIVRRLTEFPEVSAFHTGRSYLGQPIWALEVVAPSQGKYTSQSRSIVAKPVLFITGRQHANEVSSTSHILKLAELLATDQEVRKLLEDVHFVLQPITNPDGAALVEEFCRDTPDFMLHAGYLGSLGSDVTTEQWSEYPLYPEAHVRPDLWRMWLPDIVLNPHGYPSHEWVQLFAGYTAWVKSRSITARDWWIPRGWFIPGFSYMEGSRDAAFKARDRATAHLRTRLGPWNQEMYHRYAKYGVHDPETFRAQFCDDVMVNFSPKGLMQKPDGFTFMQRYPQITLLETVTEVPDEVAHGNWLKTLSQAGMEFSLATAQYLADSHQQPERTIQHTKETTILKLRRLRPYQPVS
jgi:hypothetical protein